MKYKRSLRRRSPKKSIKRRKTKSPKGSVKRYSLVCNQPQKSWKPEKKKVVLACSRGRERIIHYGAVGYGHNYSAAARKNFRARHRCDSAKDVLSARYWACKDLWSKSSSSLSPPSLSR